MVQSVYKFGVQYETYPAVARFITVPKVFKWIPTLAIWGGATGVALFFFADSITRLRHDVYQKLPLIGEYYDDTIDPQDTPF